MSERSRSIDLSLARLAASQIYTSMAETNKANPSAGMQQIFDKNDKMHSEKSIQQGRSFTPGPSDVFVVKNTNDDDGDDDDCQCFKL